MTCDLPLGWTGSFDTETSTLHLATGDATRAASVSFGPPPESREIDLLGRATRFLETETYWITHRQWEESGGRLSIGATGLVQSRSSGAGKAVNGKATGHRRRHRTGRILLGDRTYTVRHRSRWRAIVEFGGEEIAVLTRRPLSRRTRPLERTRLPDVRTSVVSEVDQLAVVLAGSVMGPPGRSGIWAAVASELGVP